MIEKLLSGKFIFTVVTALVFLYAAITGLITSEQIFAVITLVVSFYFNKSTDKK